MSSKIYSVGSIKQLVDVNKDLTNFQASFTASCSDGHPFDILVIDQDTLDNTENLQYKKVEKGSISGNVKSDSGEYQNYYIILRSDKPCKVKCDIDLQEISQAPPSQPVPQAPPSQPSHPLTQAPAPAPVRRASPQSGNSILDFLSQYKLYIVIALVVVGCLVLYYFYSKNTTSKNSTSSTSSVVPGISSRLVPNYSQPPVPQSYVQPPSYGGGGRQPPPSYGGGGRQQSNLLSRLNSL